MADSDKEKKRKQKAHDAAMRAARAARKKGKANEKKFGFLKDFRGRWS